VANLALIGERTCRIRGRLWQQDGGYRIALLLGPAPLLGAALAGIV
jgi:hypothetical protein